METWLIVCLNVTRVELKEDYILGASSQLAKISDLNLARQSINENCLKKFILFEQPLTTTKLAVFSPTTQQEWDRYMNAFLLRVVICNDCIWMYW